MTTAIPSVVSTLVTLSSEGFTLLGWFVSAVSFAFFATVIVFPFVWIPRLLRSKGGDDNG